MPPTLPLPLDSDHQVNNFWSRFARAAADWLDLQGLPARDAVVLLPFAQHLAPARRAWMSLGRWLPSIATTHSLAATLSPKPLAQPLQISLDAAIDALSARQLLHGQSWAQALAASDPRAYELAVQRLVEAAHAWQRAAGQRPPALREAWWRQARAALQQEGPGGLERALALVALEWAASDSRQPASDALFDLRPCAWVHLQCGGPEPLAEALLAAAESAGVAVLRLSADLELEAGALAAGLPGRVEQGLCEDFEELAQCAAAAVIDHLHAGRAPVALIAQDRVLVRRVRALLDRQSLPMADETGWTLATTPQAAQLMALLRAARPQASSDDWLAFLKADLSQTLLDRHGEAALSRLEVRCRSQGWLQPSAVRLEQLGPSSARLWQAGQEVLAALRAAPAQRSLADWLAALGECLQRLGAVERLQSQEAGAALLDALWLRRQPWPGTAHEAALQQSRLSLADFIDWVDASLEGGQFLPANAQRPLLIITPLARAMLRPFGAVVLPGADAQTLGPVPAGPALISDALARQLGLPSLAEKRQQLALQFAQLLRVPALTLLRCRSKGSELLAPSPLLERLQLALRAAQAAALADWIDQRPLATVAPAAQPRATALAPARLPAALSASAIESLRQCPYQFFARSLLGLREAEELQGQLDKRDYGTWLHAVLHQFHRDRAEMAGLDDGAQLNRAAEDQQRALGLAPAEFLPYAAGFARFVPRYLEWLSAHDAAGNRFASGEMDRQVQPFADLPGPLQALTLRGRIDRLDHAGGDPKRQLLIDYKTGSLAALKDKVAQPLEDTQLAVYALLMQGEPELDDQQACYLALDDARGVAAVMHEGVAHSALQLLEGLREDLEAVAGGAALPALGEGRACEYCEMRGLCRRDDWTEISL